MDVDLVTVFVSGAFAALICIPAMLIFAAAFHPQILWNLIMWLVPLIFGCPGRVWARRRKICHCLLCWPCIVRRSVRRGLAAAEEKRRVTARKATWARVQARTCLPFPPHAANATHAPGASQKRLPRPLLAAQRTESIRSI